jgi:presqualene diphosphate synthase
MSAHSGDRAHVPESDAELPARSSSFYLGMRILPPEQREAMYAIYAFCREVDDIADGSAARDERVAGLASWRMAIDAVYSGEPDPKGGFLAGPIRQFSLDKADFIAVIDGMEMDVARDIRAPDRATFDLYCDRVAVAVGRLSVKIFGLPAETGASLAHHLGRALQITNILRDLDEDLAIGRLYLPRESLMEAGIATDDPAQILSHPALDGLCRKLAAQARAHFSAAESIMDSASRRLVKAPRLMAVAYGSVLDGLLRTGWTAPRKRVGVSKTRLVLAVLRYGLV